MPTGREEGRHRWLVAGVAVTLVITVAAALWSARNEPRAPADAGGAAQRVAPTSGPPFVWSVSEDGRYFEDQYGDPKLVRGDSPWSLMTDLSGEEVEAYLADRERHGVNALIVSLLGAEANGAPADDGATFDGIRPFTGADPTSWNPAYWERAKRYVAMAERHGITVMLYPVDSWVIDSGLVPTDADVCEAYGRKVAKYFAEAPNIVWVSGGDYRPEGSELVLGTDLDTCVESVLRGIRSTGDDRPFSMQMGAGVPMTSTSHPTWGEKVDWNFVYTYGPTYRLVRRAHAHDPPIPTIFGEGNYERENNQGNQPTTNETLRRQVAWALTSGAAGDFYGSDDWEFQPGWMERLDAPGLTDVGHVRDLFADLEWWRLVPDVDGSFLTGGAGEEVTSDDRWRDVLDSDLATAAITRDGTSAVVYVPTAREITLDDTRLDPSVRAAWVDPTTGAERPTRVRSTYRTPGENADGDEDWLLVLSPGDGS